VFGTIAAESKRLINETYTAFVQSFMPNIPRPDVDGLRSLAPRSSSTRSAWARTRARACRDVRSLSGVRTLARYRFPRVWALPRRGDAY
jgi:excinuclease UvrABC ATPase subunit